MVIARWNGTVIAESDKTVVVEGNHYFPPGSVRKEFLQASSTTSRCPWKGTARYYSLWWTERPTRKPRGTTRSRRQRPRTSRTTWLSGTALTSGSTSERPRDEQLVGCALGRGLERGREGGIPWRHGAG